jgi:hypothetical protein
MRRLFKPLLVIFFISAALLTFFHWQYEQYSLGLIATQKMHDEKANALKHAVAAAEVYHVVAMMVGEAKAEKAVLLLGKWNEYLEQTVRSRNLDTPAELFKDMANNQIGITTAQWQQRTHPQGDIRQTLVSLAQDGGVIPSSQAVTLPAAIAATKSYAAIEEVYRFFEQEQSRIITQTVEKLEKSKP